MQGSSNLRRSQKPSRKAAIDGAGLATGFCAIVALPSPWVPLFGIALAAIPGAAVLGWWFGPQVVTAARVRELIVLVLVVGGLAAALGVLVYVWAAMSMSLLPGSNIRQPETPFGYVLFVLLAEATLGLFLTIPAALIAGVWAVLLRRLDGNV